MGGSVEGHGNTGYDIVGIDWLKEQSAGGYVIQFASSSRVEELVDFARSENLKRTAVYVFRLTKAGKKYYGIADGQIYSSLEAAQRRLKNSPDYLSREEGVWIRDIKSLLTDVRELGSASRDVSAVLSRELGSVPRLTNMNSRALVAMGRGKYRFSPMLSEDRRKRNEPWTPFVSKASYSPAVQYKAVARPVMVTPVTGRRHWQSRSSWGQTSAVNDKGKQYYIGVAKSRGAYTKTLRSNVQAHDPLQMLLEWRFREGTTVGEAMGKVAEFIGYELIVHSVESSGMYVRSLPVPHRELNGLTVGESMVLLAGRGYMTVYDHRTRTISHVPRRAYSSAEGLSDGKRIKTCPADIEDASVLNGLGGNVYLLKDGSICAY